MEPYTPQTAVREAKLVESWAERYFWENYNLEGRRTLLKCAGRLLAANMANMPIEQLAQYPEYILQNVIAIKR